MTRTWLVVVGAAGYAGVTGILVWQAQRAQPLFGPDTRTLTAVALLAGAVLVSAPAVVWARTARQVMEETFQ
ncbi:hypothetical protein ACIBH1_36390 [Nonomuraea sp. NPDC050663]|uniref:hypothetical protein n=1 Tax=Nonomuraea sp. NPDC050663 TaxID=3364370 RepID=UPI00379D1D24